MGLRSALASTTRIRSAHPGRPGRWTVAWYWLPGLMAGFIWFLAMWIFGATTFGFVAAVGGEALLTGARPWRGLAAIMDAWEGSRAQRSSVRRRGLVGPAGLLFVGLALLALWSGVHHGGNLVPWVWVLPPLWARAAMAWVTSWKSLDPSDTAFHALSAATDRGTGSWIPLLVALGLGVVLAGFAGVDAFGLSMVVTGAFLWWGRRMFGGMNTELQSAAVVVMEVLAVFFLVLFTAPPVL